MMSNENHEEEDLFRKVALLDKVLKLRVLFYNYREEDEDECVVALAIDMDLRGYGDTEEEAQKELLGLVRSQLEIALAKNDLCLAFFPAEQNYFKMYEEEGEMASDWFKADEAVIIDCSSAPWYIRNKPVLHIVGPSGHGAVIADLESGGDKFKGKKQDAQFIVQARERWPLYVKAMKQIEEIITDSLPDVEGRIQIVIKKL